MDVSQPIDQYVKRIQKPQTWGGAIGMFLYISCTDLMHGIVDVVQNSQYLPNSKSKKTITYQTLLTKNHSYKTEIASFDVATGRCDRFGQDEYDTRYVRVTWGPFWWLMAICSFSCILVYSGIRES